MSTRVGSGGSDRRGRRIGDVRGGWGWTPHGSRISLLHPRHPVRVVLTLYGFRSAPLHQFYDVTPDDQRFVMIRNRGAEEAGELIIVENFFEELKAKVGN